MSNDSLFLVLPVPLRRRADGDLLFEAQACNGLDQWARHFDKVVVAAPVEPVQAPSRPGTVGTQYVPVQRIAARERVEFVPLPMTYRTLQFAQALPATRRLLGQHMRQSSFLCFAIGGLVGDWASVAAIEAIKQQRRFAVWTDRVEHTVVRRQHLDVTGVRRWYQQARNNLVIVPLMQRLERYIIEHATLGLFHGHDTFARYAQWSPAPHLVHDIHLKANDRIPAEQVAEKVRRAQRGEPLRIVYAGRVVAMKGPFDWVRVLARLREHGSAFSAEWLGDGPLLDDLRQAVRHSGLETMVRFCGHVSDRATLLRKLREADVFLFCHLTPESPRCLIESLMSGTPPVGYDSPYPRDLLRGAADRLLAARGDVDGLAERIHRLDRQRSSLADAAQHAAELGLEFSDEAVFQHRSQLIKRYLSPAGQIASNPRDDAVGTARAPATGLHQPAPRHELP